MSTPQLRVAAPIARSLEVRAPVVALETAVLTHGLPRAEAREVYAQVQQEVRSAGALPAAIGVFDGELWVGLDDAQLSRLTETQGVVKAGVADLPPLLAGGGCAGGTVATTLLAAALCGIPVFATGGIGGVHRGAAESFDVSGDLTALSRYGGCVVCSGAKVILDLPKTLETLQTLGVCVVGYRTEVLPAFVCADSGLQLQHRVQSASDVCAVMAARDALQLTQAVVVANPPPSAVALPRAKLEAVLAAALAAADAAGVDGAAVTPYLLAKLAEGTGGGSLRANRALLCSNARLAAEIAVMHSRGS